jgi:hypothetical protein
MCVGGRKEGPGNGLLFSGCPYFTDICVSDNGNASGNGCHSGFGIISSVETNANGQEQWCHWLNEEKGR